MMRPGGILKLVALASAFLLVIFLAFQLMEINLDFFSDMFAQTKETEVVELQRYKCGISKPCPVDHFAFKMTSGAASIVGPKICLEDTILMSGVKNNVGRGLNIALVDGKTGNVVKTEFFDMWGGEIGPLIQFLKELDEGTIVMMATFDDSATKMTPEARKMISSLGSSYINTLSFRDNWIFVGGKGIKTKSPFEQYIKNNAESNKYEGWPEVLEMEGCIPRKLD